VRARTPLSSRPASATRCTAIEVNVSNVTPQVSTWATKDGFAQMLTGGASMDVVTPDQARIAEDAIAVIAFATRGIATPAASTADELAWATTHHDDPGVVAGASHGLGSPMRGLGLASVPVEERLAVRGS
jgi:pyridoxal biosynthesis lyase PdxS